MENDLREIAREASIEFHNNRKGPRTPLENVTILEDIIRKRLEDFMKNDELLLLAEVLACQQNKIESALLASNLRGCLKRFRDLCEVVDKRTNERE